jgi:hypothetical protein
MDYTSDPTKGGIVNDHPNLHDYEQLEAMYGDGGGGGDSVDSGDGGDGGCNPRSPKWVTVVVIPGPPSATPQHLPAAMPNLGNWCPGTEASKFLRKS